MQYITLSVMQPTSYEQLTPDGLNATFAALADPTRRAILARLASGEASVTELAAPFAMSQPAISKHLKVLERAGLISRGRDAQRRPRRVEAKPLAEATAWLENYRRSLESSFQRLDALLDELKTTRRTAARNTETHEAMEEMSNEEHGNFESHHAHGPRDRDDAGLRRAAQHGLRRVLEAGAAQALVRTSRLVAGGLRGRSPRRRHAVASCCAAPTERKWGCAASIARSCRPSRSVHTESFDDFPGESQVTTVLVEERGRRRSPPRCSTRRRKIRDAVIKSGMEHGAAESYDKLAELLASVSRR